MESMKTVRLAGNLVDYLGQVCGYSEQEIRVIADAMKRHLAVAARQTRPGDAAESPGMACPARSHLN